MDRINGWTIGTAVYGMTMFDAVLRKYANGGINALYLCCYGRPVLGSITTESGASSGLRIEGIPHVGYSQTISVWVLGS